MASAAMLMERNASHQHLRTATADATGSMSMRTGDILWSIFVTVIFLLPFVLANRIGPFLKEYKFSQEGIDFVIFGGRLRVFRIKRQNIRDATIMSRFQALLKNPFANDITNRWPKRVLFIETTGRASYVLTPHDPEAAIEALGLDL